MIDRHEHDKTSMSNHCVTWICVLTFFLDELLVNIKSLSLSAWKENIEKSISLYRVYQKKGNRTLQCSSAFIIQSTEIILSQAERPGF